jgi:hypothetical protein
MKYTVIIEKGPTKYGAYAPDVPGLGAVGDTPEEALDRFRKGAGDAPHRAARGRRSDSEPSYIAVCVTPARSIGDTLACYQ